jgi:flagellar biosynthesis/type III secretory pathway protein FliH
MDHQVIGPAIRQGLQQGLQQGRQEARQEMLKEVIEKRFGLLPASIEERWTKLSLVEREAIFDRVFQASSLGELFPE